MCGGICLCVVVLYLLWYGYPTFNNDSNARCKHSVPMLTPSHALTSSCMGSNGALGGGGGLESTERCCCVVTLLLISGTRTGDVFDRNAIHQHMLPDRCGDFDQYACHTVWHRRWAPSHCLHHQTDVLAPHAPRLHPFWNTHGW